MTSPMPDPSTMTDRIAGFSDHYGLLDGEEKGEAQVFLDRFFHALDTRAHMNHELPRLVTTCG